MNKGQAKTGRKGDPRMHRSVGARLDNPELSLFEALRMGGFDYAADEDASIMDSEKVTLGQRKNQLSRRLRLARKQQEEAGGDGMLGMDDAMGVGVGGLPSAMLGGAALNAKVKLQLQQQQQQNGAMSSEAQRQLEKLMQHSQQAKLSSGVKRNAQLAELGVDAEMHLNDEEANIMDEKNPRRMAKFHPQYQQLFIPRAASIRNSFTGGGALSAQLSSQLTGTPQLGPLSAPLTPLMAPPSTSSFAAAAAANPGLFPSASGLLGQQAVLSQRRSAANLPSGVAVASLSTTAQSVGLSLEQLAVALSSSSNLVKVLSNNAGSEQQQELALRLFRNESRALYQRCMLLAGFRPEDAEEKSQNHLQFAFSAWQMEGKRLQELMGDDNGRNINGNGARAPVASMIGNGMNGNSMNGNSMNGMAGLNGQLSVASSNAQQQQLQQMQQQLQQEQKMQQQQELQQQSHSAHGHGHHNHESHHKDEGQQHESHGHDDSTGHNHSHGHSHEHHVDGHHIHQLEGKCGHKAIIHQPKDGSAHIDFIVGDRVECYSGIQPMGNKSLSVWPSKYKCEDLSCPAPCADQLNCDTETAEPVDLDSSKNAPRILDLSDVDLSGAEWNSDLNGSMGGTLLGLFKLGDSEDKDQSSSGQNGDNGGGEYEISV